MIWLMWYESYQKDQNDPWIAAVRRIYELSCCHHLISRQWLEGRPSPDWLLTGRLISEGRATPLWSVSHEEQIFIRRPTGGPSPTNVGQWAGPTRAPPMGSAPPTLTYLCGPHNHQRDNSEGGLQSPDNIRASLWFQLVSMNSPPPAAPIRPFPVQAHRTP